MRTRRLLIVPFLAFLMAAKCPWESATVLHNIESALVIALAAAQVSGEVPVEYQRYVDAALGGIACQSAEAATNDSIVLKATKLTACLSGVFAPVLPPGTPQDLVKRAHDIAEALQRILSGLPPPVRSQVAVQGPPDVPWPADKAKALEMKERAQAGLKQWRNSNR